MPPTTTPAAHPALRQLATRRVRPHARVVPLPAHGFATHRIERMTLTGLHMTRVVTASPVIEARLARTESAPLAPVVAPELDQHELLTAFVRRSDRAWGIWSVLLVLAVILAALGSTGMF